MTDLLGQPTKRCRACQTEKPLDAFYANPGGRDGTRPECKACTRERRRAWYTQNRAAEIERVRAWQFENPDKVKARMDAFRAAGKKKLSDRKSHLKRKYGLTLEDFDRMLAAQQGGCAICGELGVDHVDHDHSTGVVRGILCFRCNAAIGQLDDSPERARLLAQYLERDDELTALAQRRAAALVSA